MTLTAMSHPEVPWVTTYSLCQHFQSLTLAPNPNDQKRWVTPVKLLKIEYAVMLKIKTTVKNRYTSQLKIAHIPFPWTNTSGLASAVTHIFTTEARVISWRLHVVERWARAAGIAHASTRQLVPNNQTDAWQGILTVMSHLEVPWVTTFPCVSTLGP